MLDALLFAKTPRLLTSVYKECVWKIPTAEKVLYLTFDDGPIPEATPFVLNELKKHNALASFFCIGKNVVSHEKIFQRTIAEGHTIGNHTYDHLNGWKTENDVYFKNIEKCQEQFTIYDLRFTKEEAHKQLFRPPYGKLTPAQYSTLKSKYSLVMWDVLSFDFDLSISKERVLKNVLKNAEAGSIIVMHDSVKAFPKLEYALPRVLEHFSERGFSFARL